MLENSYSTKKSNHTKNFFKIGSSFHTDACSSVHVSDKFGLNKLFDAVSAVCVLLLIVLSTDVAHMKATAHNHRAGAAQRPQVTLATLNDNALVRQACTLITSFLISIHCV